MDFYHHEQETEKKRIRKQKPLEKLQDNLVEWMLDLQSYQMDPVDIEMFQTKMWQMVADFEQDLKQEEKGFKIQNKRLMEQNDLKIKQLKLKYSFRIEALEQAINELKLRHDREKEQMNMYLNEMETYHMNLEIKGRYKDHDSFVKDQFNIFGTKGIKEVKI